MGCFFWGADGKLRSSYKRVRLPKDSPISQCSETHQVPKSSRRDNSCRSRCDNTIRKDLSKIRRVFQEVNSETLNISSISAKIDNKNKTRFMNQITNLLCDYLAMLFPNILRQLV